MQPNRDIYILKEPLCKLNIVFRFTQRLNDLFYYVYTVRAYGCVSGTTHLPYGVLQEIESVLRGATEYGFIGFYESLSDFMAKC